MPTTQLDVAQTLITDTWAMYDTVSANNQTAQDLLDQADAELDAAQTALNAAKAALQENPPNEALAKQKLAESLDHTAKAIDLIKQAIQAN